MLFAILCYDSEAAVCAWTPEQDAAVMQRLEAVQAPIAAAGRLGPVARLAPTTRARTVRKGAAPLVLDGPFAETKEQLLGLYVVDCETHEAAVAVAEELARASGSAGAFEVRPMTLFRPGSLGAGAGAAGPAAR